MVIYPAFWRYVIQQLSGFIQQSEPSTVFTSILGLPTNWIIGTHIGFSPALWPLPFGTFHRFSPAFKHGWQRCSPAFKKHSSWWFYCEEWLWKLHYALLDLGIREIHFGSRFGRGIDSTTGRPPRKFARLENNKNGGLSNIRNHPAIDKLRGSVVREQNHLWLAFASSLWFLNLIIRFLPTTMCYWTRTSSRSSFLKHFN